MKTEKKDEKKKPENVVMTPIGRISYPYLIDADTGRPCSSGKRSGDLFISKDKFKEDGQELVKLVLKVAREFYKKPDLTLKDFKHPFRDVDTLKADIKDKLPEAVRSGHILIKAKTGFDLDVIGPDKSILSPDEIKKIKGGDYCRFVVKVYPYKQQGGGVTLGLNLVQFARPGEAFGQGKSSAINMVDEIEVTADDIPMDEPNEEQDNAFDFA